MLMYNYNKNVLFLRKGKPYSKNIFNFKKSKWQDMKLQDI